MRLAVIGTGYVGLVAGVCFAESGNDVVCVDKDAAKVRALKAGKMPIYEPGLEELLRRNVGEKRLTFTTALPAAVKDAAVVFIAVGTPQGEDGAADLRHVLDVARQIARAINGYTVIVNKSTVPVGTSERVRMAMHRETKQPFSVVSNPEFLKQGAAVDDFMKPDRVVIGADDSGAVALMQELYAPFTRTDAPIMVMDCASAELSKYAANAMLATRISFMNEVANVCERVGADVDHVRRAMGRDRRIGTSFLFPGVGFGGSCFPKDVKAMQQFAADNGYDFKMLRAVDEVNTLPEDAAGGEDARALRPPEGQDAGGLGPVVQAQDRRHARGPLDCRSSRRCSKAGARVQAYDPEAMKVARRHLRLASDVRRHELRRAEGGRRAGHRDRVERVPPARPGPHEEPAQGTRRLRRAQPVRARQDEAAWVHLLLDRPHRRRACRG